VGVPYNLLNLPFHNPDLVLGQPVELVDQLIDLPVRRLDLALEAFFLVGQVGRWLIDSISPAW
jgi:hypothetical protein